MTVPPSFRPVVLASACLCQCPVRYNGSPVRSRPLEGLARHATIVPACPEVAAGLPTPRPELRLVAFDGKPRLQQRSDGSDLTATVDAAVDRIVARLPALDGAILKSKSPTCGVDSARIYSTSVAHQAAGSGTGLFTRRLLDLDPTLPMVEEGRLNDPRQRQQFYLRVFARARLRVALQRVRRPADLTRFHRSEKLLLMAFHPEQVAALGRIAASASRANLAEAIEQYASRYQAVVAGSLRKGRLANALDHAVGYVSRDLARDERHYVLDQLRGWREGRQPLAVPLALLRASVLRLEQRWLAEQSLLRPWPFELEAVDALA